MQHADTRIFKKSMASAIKMHPLNKEPNNREMLLKTHSNGGKLLLYQTPFTIFVDDLAEGKTNMAKNSGLVNNNGDKAERQ